MTRYAHDERRALADLLAQVGPDAPTLCGGWTTRQLVAHLLLRERHPSAALGILARRFADRTARVQDEIAAGDYLTLIEQLRRPPWWSPSSNPLVHELVNLNELFIHHEDVRRAQPGWQPRRLSHGMDAALWQRAKQQAKLSLRRYRAAVTIASPGHGQVRAGVGGDPITIEGPPGELNLFLSGRQAHAQVKTEGPVDAVDRLERARLGV
jgi:uncharacterized protein (TIGR03085 family)